MKATELRIGNYVTETNIGVTLVNLFDLENIQNEDTNYQPIPLTEEWLLKLGFKLYPSGSYCFDLFSVNEYLAIDLKYNKGFAYIRTDEDSLKIKLEYVHQLQNLYFALTNLELEIN